MEKEWLTPLYLLGLFLAGFILVGSFKLVMRLFLYLIVGLVMLYLANLLLDLVGLKVAINPVTIFTAGMLHIPGIILLAILNYLY